ncbi:MAG: hypothetical protein NTZ65_04035 [Candidatus Berkelbacteria bacterium]|nr:hypothetical protein [Candidatus Berkelbacteria bacterium]
MVAKISKNEENRCFPSRDFRSQLIFSGAMLYFARSDYERRVAQTWAVNCNWNADNGWNLNANPISNPNSWNADNQVFSHDSLLFFRFGGSF